jgi:prepilin-type processing-associated H-X9-DG protein
LSRSFYRSYPNSFTATELLLSVVILAIVLAFLIPWFQERRKRTGRISCMNNLRQIALGVQQYAGEHGGRFPESGTPSVESHARLLSKAVGDAGQIFKCSADHEKKLAGRADTITDRNISYCYVTKLTSNAPPAMPLWFERGMGISSAAPLASYAGRSWMTTEAHGTKGGNIAFADAHVDCYTVFPPIPVNQDGVASTNEVLFPK